MKRQFKIGEYVQGVVVMSLPKQFGRSKTIELKCCSCGKLFERKLSWLCREYMILSCGCYKKRRPEETYDPRYSHWKSLISSADREGVYVKAKWRYDFKQFCRDVGPKPSKNHSLRRIYPECAYLPNNMYWKAKEPKQATKNLFKMLALQPKLNDNTSCN